MKEMLEDLGLSKNESIVYMALIRLGQSSTTQLSREVELHRGYIYDVLDSLKEKGLVSAIKSGRATHFSAAPPNNLLSYADEKQQEYEEVKIKIKKNIEKFHKLQNTHKQSEAMLFEGKSGVKSVFEEMLSAKEIMTYGANGFCTKRYPPYYRTWDNKRVKNKIPLKILFDTERTEDTAESTKLVQIKKLNLEENEIVNTVIYGDKVAIIIWDEKPVVTRIQSSHAAKAYRNYFNLLWKKAKK